MQFAMVILVTEALKTRVIIRLAAHGVFLAYCSLRQGVVRVYLLLQNCSRVLESACYVTLTIGSLLCRPNNAPGYAKQYNAHEMQDNPSLRAQAGAGGGVWHQCLQEY